MGWRIGFWAITVSVLLFLIGPLLVVMGASFNEKPILNFPPEGFTLRWYPRILEHPEFVSGFRLSFQLAVVATVISCVLGTLASLAIVRHRFPGSSVLNSIILSPLILPRVVFGLACLLFFIRAGFIGTFWGLVLAHTMVAVPYVVRTVIASLTGLDPQLEEAARNLGAGPVRTFWRITLPLMTPGLMAGGIFSFIVSFDELVVTLFLAGTHQVTLPIRIFTYVQFDSDPFIAAVSTLLILMSFFGVFLLDRLIGVTRFL